MRLTAALLMLVALAGCDSNTTSSLELVIDRTEFAAGDDVLLVLDNDTGQDRTYSPCPELFRFTEPGMPMLVESDVVCPDVLNTIRSGQSVPFRVALAPDLPAGTYFVALAADIGPLAGNNRQLSSKRFEVVE